MDRGPVEHAAAWFITGPVGHLVFGAIDLAALLARSTLRRVSGRHPWTGEPRR